MPFALRQAQSLRADSESRIHTDPEGCLASARESVAVCMTLRPGVPANNDERALSFGWLANVLRVANQLELASANMRQAWCFHEAGAQVPEVTARLEEWAASLCRDRREFELALACADRALYLRKRCGDDRATGRTLIKKSSIQIEAGDPAGARETLRQAMRYVDAQDAPDLARHLVHNAAMAHVEMGMPDRALACLQDAEAAGIPPVESLWLQDKWLRARILGSQNPDLAEPELAEVVSLLLAQNRQYDAALAGLELAMLQPKDRALETLEMVRPVFDRLGIQREAVAARLLRDAIAGGSLETALPQLKGALKSYSSRDFTVSRRSSRPPGYTGRPGQPSAHNP